MRKLILVLALLLIACAPVTTVTTPSPMADVAPQAQPDPYMCVQVATADGFDMTCVEPSPTPTATPTPNPAENQFLCNGDVRCASGQFRVYWDRNLSMLRCALPQGDKVTLVANGYSKRQGEGEPLAWVVTGADAGGVPCEGWVPATFIQPAK